MAAASWLKQFLAPIQILINGVTQSRDDRVDFRYGFTSSQVPDVDGVNVLTIDTDVGAATFEPGANTVAKRNGSGALKATTAIATTYSFTSLKTIEWREPIRVFNPGLVAAGAWITNASLELESDVNTSLQWQAELQLVPGSKLASVSAVYTPAGGHVGLPADQPYIELYSIEYGAAPVLIDSLQDTAADVTAYQTKRTLTITLSPTITVNPNRRYVLQFGSETGANALSGLTLHAPAIWTAEVNGVWA